MLPKPKLILTGQDGNAFNILGRASRAARKSGWEQVQIDQFIAEASSSNYDHLLQTCMKYFEVE